MTIKPLALHPPRADVRIRPVQLTDVAILHQRCWAERPRSAIDQLVNRAQQIARQGRGLGVVVWGDAREDVRGYGQLTMWPRGGEISDLMIMPQYRQCGLGTAIIQYLVRAAHEMRATTVEIGVALSNPRALALYRRLGFQDDHTVMIDLGNGPEAVLYLDLKLPPRY